MTFRSLDGRRLLSMHNKDKSLDIVSKDRKIIWDTLEDKKAHYGFEVDKLKLSYRVVLPLMDDSSFYGTVELGIDPDYFLANLKKSLKIKTALLVRKNQYENFALLSQDKDFQWVFKNLELDKDTLHQFDDKTYIIHEDYKLKNHKNETIAYLLVKQDITDEISLQQALLIKIVVVFVLSFIATMIILYLAFNLLLQEIKKKLYIDPLTGLNNLVALEDDIVRDEKNRLMVLLDVNNFSEINDMYGSKNANEVLKRVAGLVQEYALEYEMKGHRIGSDQFVLIKEHEFIDVDETEKFLDKLRAKILAEEFLIDTDDTYGIDVTMGIALSGVDVFKEAEMALRYAKKHKYNYIAFSTLADSRASTAKMLALKKNIHYALNNDEVEPFFQPITDKNRKIIKYESLVRLIGANGLGPEEFLPVAVKYGIYSQITKIMIQKSLELFSQREEQISINLVNSDMESREILKLIKEKMQDYPHPEHVVFEIVEQAGIEDYTYVAKFIEKIHSYGAKIAIDDFGTGYSNFEHILKLKPDYIKIDGSLVKNILVDKKSEILVKSIVEFSHALGIKVIAEYVESEEVFVVLRAIGVDEYQGYYFGKPTEFANIAL
jgi:diguanylate cyclase (GGDEF)-like protein